VGHSSFCVGNSPLQFSPFWCTFARMICVYAYTIRYCAMRTVVFCKLACAELTNSQLNLLHKRKIYDKDLEVQRLAQRPDTSPIRERESWARKRIYVGKDFAKQVGFKPGLKEWQSDGREESVESTGKGVESCEKSNGSGNEGLGWSGRVEWTS